MRVISKTDIPGMVASDKLSTGLLTEVKKSSWQHNATFLSSSHKAKLTGKFKKDLKNDTGLHILVHYIDKIHETGIHTPPHGWSGQDYKKNPEYSTIFFFQEVEASNNIAFQLQQWPHVENGVGALCTEIRWISSVQPQHKCAFFHHQKMQIENKLPVPSMSSVFRVMINASHVKDKLWK